ncbi:MAG: RNA polymerase sigma factor [Firmicutes bacterium]|nr:RNA polymerase sigma factor [Bacillota bacterium]
MAIRRSPKGRNRNDSAAGASSSSDVAQSRREGSAVPGVGDQELVLRMVARDEEALGLLVEAMRVPIFTFARQIVLDDHLAEEVTQDTFLVVWENASGFEVGRRVVPWVFAIARNLARTAARTAARRLKRLAAAGRWAELEPADARADPHAEVEGTLLHRQVRRAMAALAPCYREVLELRLHLNMTYEEIAEVCGIPMGTVKSRIHKGLRNLRARLREQGITATEGEE